MTLTWGAYIIRCRGFSTGKKCTDLSRVAGVSPTRGSAGTLRVRRSFDVPEGTCARLRDRRMRRRARLIPGHSTGLALASIVRIPTSTRAAHMYIISTSDKGKSKFLESCLCQTIAVRRGCGLIDPHSLMASDLLRQLITNRILDAPEIRDRLIYVDPARTDYVIPFTVLASEAEYPYDIAVTVMAF